AIEAQDGLVLLPPAAVTGLDVETHAARLVTEDGDTVTGRVILACDGPSSPLREMAAIRTVGWEYGQAGIVATITHSADHERVAAQHFLPAGPLAMLPLPGRRTSIVWAESTCRARELDALDDKAFTAALAERIGTRLGEIALVTGTRASWPLRLQLARSLTANRLCLFGEAARTVHPLAGQGLNIAARDAAAFADVAGDALALGIDPGNAATLDGYSRARRFDASMSALAFDALNRLFAMRAPIVRSLRDAGLEWVDRSPRLKEIFVREAAGLAGDDVPSLMRNAPARGRQPADAGAL
ncbi:MAG: FAD-dependent monooxygenase, partial [Pseudomonadota bacterium]